MRQVYSNKIKDITVLNITQFSIYVARHRRAHKYNLLSLPACFGEEMYLAPPVEDSYGERLMASRNPRKYLSCGFVE